ncbi:MAG TPA: response regulator [Spirochaetota bacterium]|nr:response regulator [Spirochaetota bacterium]HOS41196.1 response regulator [Spirochaetota bacterium]HPI22786.1 response regulator [Spirochaetota bacterium]HPU90468.1 response regulator [Spirochaetota bacterium]
MKYIMVIDDSPTIRTSIQFAIKETGYPVVPADNGRVALEKVKELKEKGDELALVMVDVNMPEMDGITFIKHFRQEDRFTPILVLTTESQNEKIKEGKDAGASGWMVKPFQQPQLLQTVQRLVR